MTPEELRAIRERCEAASAGPWHGAVPACGHEHDPDEDACAIEDASGAVVASCVGRDDDFRFVMHARTDVPALLDEVERLNAATEKTEHAMHMRIRASYDATIADAWRTEVAKVSAERDEVKDRLRKTAQILIDEFGASGPMNADDMAAHAVADLNRISARAHVLEIERDEARALLREVAEVCRELSPPTDAALSVVGPVLRERDEAFAEVERLTRELQIERCGVRPVDELLQRVTTDRDELHVAWKREHEEVERLTRERDDARDRILEYTDALVERDAELRATRETYNGMRAELARLTDLNATQAKTLDALFAEAERLRAILGGGGFTYSEGETALRAQLASALTDAAAAMLERDELRARLVVEQSK